MNNCVSTQITQKLINKTTNHIRSSSYLLIINKYLKYVNHAKAKKKVLISVEFNKCQSTFLKYKLRKNEMSKFEGCFE